ncbi:MAG: hypothetical protein IPM34_13230 [Saprospiraceae bacterium]|nr:hypothetical protein [Saprospiraceae bacterium]
MKALLAKLALLQKRHAAGEKQPSESEGDKALQLSDLKRMDDHGHADKAFELNQRNGTKFLGR